jgi:Zn-dependent protease with chaperone function
MRIRPAERSFWSIVALAGGVGAGAWVVFCCGAWVLWHEVAVHGPAGLVVPRLLPSLLLAVVLVVAVFVGGWSIIDQVGSTRRLERFLERRRLPLGPVLTEAAAVAGLSGRVALVESSERFSCTLGILRPRVVVTKELLDTSTPGELAAVLAHEAHHVRTADPLKMVIARSLARSLFVLPVLGRLYERYLAGRELAADRKAIRSAGTAGLAGALLKTIAGPSGMDIGAAAALGGEHALELRLSQLETGIEPAFGSLGRRTLYLSGAGALTLGGGMLTASLTLGPLVSQFCQRM